MAITQKDRQYKKASFSAPTKGFDKLPLTSVDDLQSLVHVY